MCLVNTCKIGFKNGTPERTVTQYAVEYDNYHVIVVIYECSGVQDLMISMLFIFRRVYY